MAFEVGSIVGRLELDRNPFTEGLRAARAQADAFERNDVTATLDVDTAHADEKIATTDAELDRLDHKKVTPKVDVDTREAGQGIGLLGTAIIALGPAAIAAGGVAAGALAPLALATAGIAAVAIPALKNLHDAATKTGAAQQKALTDLGPGAAPAIVAFRTLTAQWNQFRAATNPQTFALLGATFTLLGTSLRAFTPFVQAAATAATHLVQGLTPLVPIFAQAFGRMTPIINAFTNGLLHMAQSLANWTQGQGFLHFVQYVIQVGPQLVHTLGMVAQLFIQIGVAGAQILPAILHVVSALAQLLTMILRIPGIGPAIVAFAAIGTVAFKVGQGVLWAGKAFGIAALEGESAFGALGAAASVLFANPIIAAAAAIVAALAYIVTHWQQVVHTLQGLWQGALDFYNSTIGQIPGLHIGPDHPNVLQQTVDNAIKARQGGGGDFAPGVPSSAFGGGNFSQADLAAGQVPAFTMPRMPAIKAPKMPKMGKTPTIRVPAIAPIAGVPHALVTPRGTRTGSTGSSVPHATGGSVQAITGGGLAGPRSIAHDFTLADEGITGQSVIFRHSPNYGQHANDKHASAVDKNTKQLKRVGDLMEKDQKRPVATINMPNPNNGQPTVTTVRRRGQAKR